MRACDDGEMLSLIRRAEEAEAERDEAQAEVARMTEALHDAEAKANRLREALDGLLRLHERDPDSYGNVEELDVLTAARAALRGEGGA